MSKLDNCLVRYQALEFRREWKIAGQMIPANKTKALELVLRALSLGHLSLSLMGVSWVQPSSIKDMVAASRRRMKNSWVSCAWKMIPLAIS